MRTLSILFFFSSIFIIVVLMKYVPDRHPSINYSFQFAMKRNYSDLMNHYETHVIVNETIKVEKQVTNQTQPEIIKTEQIQTPTNTSSTEGSKPAEPTNTTASVSQESNQQKKEDKEITQKGVFQQTYKKDRKQRKFVDVYNPETYVPPPVVEHFLEKYYKLNTTLPPNIKFGGYTDIADFVDYYIFWHNQVAKDTSVKTICFFPTRHGLANKLFGMVSVLFFAMLTGRKFEVCGWRAFDYYFDPPFVVKKRPPNYKGVHFDFTHACQRYPDLEHFNIEAFDKEKNYVINSNCRMVYDFYGNPAFKYRLQELGIDLRYSRGQDNDAYLYHIFLTRVFPLSKSIRSKVEEFSSDWDHYCVIGIHVRTGDASLSKYPPHTKAVLKKMKPSSQKALEISKQCTKPVKWFLTTDSQYLKEEYYKLYPQYIIYYNATLIHSGVETIYNFNKGVVDTFVDVSLLAKANYRLITVGTTYGYLGAILAGTNNTLY